VLAAALLAGSPAAGGNVRGATGDQPFILVVELDGLVDPVTVDLVVRSLREAEEGGAALFVLAVDSPGGVDVDAGPLLRAVAESRVPVVGWVKAGGSARGLAAAVVLASDVAAMATDASLGPLDPLLLDRDVPTPRGPRADALGRRLGPDEAEAKAVVSVVAPALRDLIASVDGREVRVGEQTVRLDLGRVVPGSPKEKQVLPIRFRQFGLGDQALHALTNPFVAYLLLVLGLSLVVFEFFAVGIGLAAAAGALALVGAFVGLAHLPVSALGLALLLAGFLGISVDVQAGRPAAWAVIGAGLLAAGSFTLFAGSSMLDPPWWQVALVLVGALLFLLPGLSAVVRARFSTPTIGRDSMVGATGTVQEDLVPEGVVDVGGGLWPARATRAAGLGVGDQVRVTAVAGVTLEVEPLDGTEAAEAPEDA